MNTISLIFFLVALSANPAISKIYEYKNYLEENNIKPIVKSSEENSVDVIEFSSFSCSHCAAFHNETLKELKFGKIFIISNILFSTVLTVVCCSIISDK